MKEKNDAIDCATVRETLEARWVEGSSACAEDPGDLVLHLESCPDCRGAADEIRRMDDCLRAGLRDLEAFVGPVSEETVEETLRRVHEATPEAELLRRVRRPLRMVLWGTFFAFTLLACSALAVALYKAILGR